MNLDKYRREHADIIRHVQELKKLTALGIAGHAAAIAREVIAMSSVIKLHLSVEDRFLYPALQEAGAALAAKGRQYQEEMADIAAQYGRFSRQWNDAQRIAEQPEGFRADANRVLKILFDRIGRENRDFYPLIEAT
ncbi:hemerythrin domain-containing protein [Herbaspirillum robiniae]|uniref:Hemerythrin n=1 Tax=Herbaspirillum robiniae TaxID=2014887 RepID=A0A246WTX3_9BURK|nr:hemerythrin domain-containing protein [Herbaspirillum robiniae]OWY30517.1 hemerythrin [Herbaspirillum robiniae]